jgi:hypothetical protein
MIKTVRTLQIAYFALAVIGVILVMYYNYRRLQILEQEVKEKENAKSAQ